MKKYFLYFLSMLIAHTVIAQTDNNAQAGKETEEKDGHILINPEQQPSFPGGQVELMKYMKINLLYPEKALKDSVKGRVVVTFMIGKADGCLTDVKVVQSLSPETDAEALRLIKSMPCWIPGKLWGEPKDTYYSIPVRFDFTRSDHDAFPLNLIDSPPQFPGGDKKMRQYLRKNNKVFMNGETLIEVPIQFIVKKDGRVSNATILQPVSPEIDAQALALVESMPRWKPAKVAGKAVNVIIEKSVLLEHSAEISQPEPNIVAPQFPGGKEVLSRFLATNLQYPYAARKAKLQGKVIVRFFINEDGSVSDAEIIKGLSRETNAEAIRLVESIPAVWTPGMKDGKPVRVHYNLPIKFSLKKKNDPW